MNKVLLKANQTIKALMTKETKESLLTAQSILVACKMACDELRRDELFTPGTESQIEAACYQDGVNKQQTHVLNARFMYLTERSERLLYGYSDDVGELTMSSDEFYHLSQFISDSLTRLKAIQPETEYIDFEFEQGIKGINDSLNRLEQVLVESIQTLINRFQLLLMHEGELRRRYSVLNRQTVDTPKLERSWGLKRFFSYLNSGWQSVL